ncbi:LpqN/LpqT family lipoprotein [Mycobacterium sp. IDR2000157661]|uniref:LpqN/LpqT family lipoprotein n=1 Tax=Mycobacterium sp. IDR2000157661 TaxID=2867005 RepID=UPI001EED8301|nr:LpqN/LpqT family lipoprotein [Mycobacterium sp. IDR2000157661]ULE35188.1 LpqN/LpqT family lipoprotein [Mycobacterium sp. IDR2000157661]
MRSTVIPGAAAVAATLALVLTACGSDSDLEGTPVAEPSTTTTSAQATSPSAKIAPRDEDPAGPNPTIATYIAENGISETPVKRGDPGSPNIDLPIPEGWQDAGPDTPEWAYGAIVYTGPEATEYTPSIVAIVSKLTGNVDPQAIIDAAPGELQNLPGWSAMNDGSTSTLGNYPAYELGGTWQSEGQAKLVAQKTVVIPGPDGVFVLQLNVDGLEDQADVIGPATLAIDDETTIGF